MKRAGLSVVVGLGLAMVLGVPSHDAQGNAVREFEHASVVFEQNATDGDVEVVFRVTGGHEGLKHLTVTGPEGQKVFEVDSPGGSMGMRQFNLESPEPSDDGALRTAFPQGTYTFSAESVSGVQFKGSATLEHALPEVVRILNPSEDAGDVASENLQIRWSPVRGVSGYVLELEHEESGASLTVNLPADAQSFNVPNGFLQAGSEYMLGIGTQSRSGNASFVEIGFETAE